VGKKHGVGVQSVGLHMPANGGLGWSMDLWGREEEFRKKGDGEIGVGVDVRETTWSQGLVVGAAVQAPAVESAAVVADECRQGVFGEGGWQGDNRAGAEADG